MPLSTETGGVRRTDVWSSIDSQISRADGCLRARRHLVLPKAMATWIMLLLLQCCCDNPATLRIHISHIPCSFSSVSLLLPAQTSQSQPGDNPSQPPLHIFPHNIINMKSSVPILGLAALAATAHADLLQTRNLRTRAKEPTKKKFNDLVEEDMDFWGRELGGSSRRNLKAIKKNDKAMKNEDNQFWARELGGSARK